MGAPTPTLETVISAIKTELLTVTGVVDVFEYEHTAEDPWEFLEDYQHATTGAVNVWLIDVESIDEEEGPANRENYSIYNVRIRYICVRVNEADWSKEGRVFLEAVRDKLNFNANVFAISGQRQLRTPETCSLRTWGFEDEADQRVYKGELGLSIEARRFS